MRAGISLLGRKSGGPRGCRKRQARVVFTAGKALAGKVRVYGQVVKSGGPRALGCTGGKGLCGWQAQGSGFAAGKALGLGLGLGSLRSHGDPPL